VAMSSRLQSKGLKNNPHSGCFDAPGQFLHSFQHTYCIKFNRVNFAAAEGIGVKFVTRRL
jgi:hypothetical protein